MFSFLVVYLLVIYFPFLVLTASIHFESVGFSIGLLESVIRYFDCVPSMYHVNP